MHSTKQLEFFHSLSLVIIFILLTHICGWTQSVAVNGIGDTTTTDCFYFMRQGALNTGSYWTNSRYSFEDSLDILIQFNLDCRENSGDGITFGFQTIGPFAGNYASRMGVKGLLPSLFIEIDVDPNPEDNDPDFDHIAILRDGDLNHAGDNNLAGPVPVGPDENYDFNDCNDHTMRIVYVPDRNRLQVYIDCQLKLETSIPSQLFPEMMNRFHYGGTVGLGDSDAQYNLCVNPAQRIAQIETIDLGCDDSIRLMAPFLAEQYEWTPREFIADPFEPNPFVRVGFPAQYRVTGIDECGIRTYQEYNLVSAAKAAFIYGIDTILCLGDNLQYDFGDSVIWNNGDQGAIFITEPGIYFAEQADDCPVENIDSIVVREFSEPTLSLGEDQIRCQGEPIRLGGYPTAFDVRWQDGSQSSTFLAMESGIYSVQIESACGLFEDDIQLEFLPCEEMYVPNAFTPGIDDINDYFKPLNGMPDTEIIRFAVFDRWGNQIYLVQNQRVESIIGWDGSANGSFGAPGEYSYVLEWVLPTNEIRKKGGSFVLIR